MENTTKKLNLKKAVYAHLLSDGALEIHYREKHKTSGKDIEWHEVIAPENVPFKCRVSKFMSSYPDSSYKYRSIYITDRILPLLNDVTSIEIWPENASKDATYSLRTIIFNLKNKACLSFNCFTHEGKKFNAYDVDLTF